MLGDERGFFCETYRRDDFRRARDPRGDGAGQPLALAATGSCAGCTSRSATGAAKLVRCARGAIYDVVVDLRSGSPTFGQWEGFELTEENMRMAYCPVGFAHGFCVISDVADVMYKQSNYYADETERGIAYNDPEVGIEWPLPVEDLIPSARDATAPRLSEIADELPFVYERARRRRLTARSVRPMVSSQPTHDLAIIVISTNEAHWLGPCLSTVYDHAGTATLDVIVVDNESTDGTREFVESSFPQARVVTSHNGGFGYANNRGWESANARYALFLNPDTEIVDGTFGELVDALDARPEVGLAGVRQVTGDGELYPSMRRFPNAARALGEALCSERWPVHPSWAGERVIDMRPTTRSRNATGPSARSCSPGARRCSAPASWTSGSSSSARSRTSACG